ncbi:MAG TPA: cupin domain-containing protein [Chitinophagaceae bacterium]|nr:cupin domain-containing protein [Chitinophagaceae bacterium]
MSFLNFNTKNRVKIWEGINGALFHSDKITIGHMIIDNGTPLPEHSHPHEQWLNVIEGELELTVGDETQVLHPGMSAYIPSNVSHSGKALTECKVIDVFSPVREDFVALEK